MTKAKKIIAYKGFDSKLRCRNMQYEIGKEYKHKGDIDLCHAGFHACLEPIDVFTFYYPGTSRYCKVELSGKIIHDDRKTVCSKIKILREIPLDEYIKLAADHNEITNKVTTKTGNHSVAANTGYYSAATNAGECSIATNSGCHSAATTTGFSSAANNIGTESAATTTGNHSVAINTGSRSTAVNTGNHSATVVSGKESIACGLGYGCRAKASEGSWIALVERNANSEIIDAKFAKAGRDIKADVFYILKDGEFVEVGSE